MEIVAVIRTERERRTCGAGLKVSRKDLNSRLAVLSSEEISYALKPVSLFLSIEMMREEVRLGEARRDVSRNIR